MTAYRFFSIKNVQATTTHNIVKTTQLIYD